MTDQAGHLDVDTLKLIAATQDIAGWDDHKVALTEYFSTLVRQIRPVGNIGQTEIRSLRDAAAAVTIGSAATAKQAAEAGEAAEAVGLWSAARVCHDMATQIGAAAAVAAVDDPRQAGTLSMLVGMFAIVGADLIAETRHLGAETGS